MATDSMIVCGKKAGHRTNHSFDPATGCDDDCYKVDPQPSTTTPSVEAANVAELREALHPPCRVENCRIEKLIADFEQAIASAARAEAEQRAARLETAGDALAIWMVTATHSPARCGWARWVSIKTDPEPPCDCGLDAALDGWQAAKGGTATQTP